MRASSNSILPRFKVFGDICQINVKIDAVHKESQADLCADGVVLIDPNNVDPKNFEEISWMLREYFNTKTDKVFMGVRAFNFVVKHKEILVHRDCVGKKEGYVWHAQFNISIDEANLPPGIERVCAPYYLTVVPDKYNNFYDVAGAAEEKAKVDGHNFLGFNMVGFAGWGLLNL